MQGREKINWFLSIDSFSKITMQILILHVELMNGPIIGGCNIENNSNSSRLDDRTKGFLIINIMLLNETTNNPVSFVSCNRAIRVLLVAVDPFAHHYIDTCRFRKRL
jgi:hypothetical protein